MWNVSWGLKSIFTRVSCPPSVLQVPCVRVRDGRAYPFPESHDWTPPMGARRLLAALLRLRPLDQSGGRDEGSRQHARAGEHRSQRDEVGSLWMCVCDFFKPIQGLIFFYWNINKYFWWAFLQFGSKKLKNNRHEKLRWTIGNYFYTNKVVIFM